jgi:AhpD family alkylhydroperoxidase
MTRIPALAIEQAPDATRPIWEEIKSQFGVLLKVFKPISHSPAFACRLIQFDQAMEKSSLSPKQSETVSLAVSQINGCAYCMIVHHMTRPKVGRRPKIYARQGD